jgi:mannitol-1-phosphate 5-dehydrogenase
MQRAVQFGAGNIGRGFMGQLFFEAGYHITFVEYAKPLVNLMNERESYTLRLLAAYSKSEIDMQITNYDALPTDAVDDVAKVFAAADVAGTAVGVPNLKAIAPLVVAGIRARRDAGRPPIDIYLCENIYGAGEMLKEHVFAELSSDEQAWAEANVGFIGTSVARMVPAASDRFGSDDPLFVVADSYHKLPYDGPARRAPEPAIDGIRAVSNFRAEVERKLFTHNLGHAAMGYIGYLKGYSYVHEPFDDEFLSPIFDGALDETTEALLKMYPDDLDRAEHMEIRKDVRVRFGNPMIMDSLPRVARDPLRKLGPKDRLIGSARMCLEHGVFPKNIAYICGAAFHYDNPDDPSAVKLQEIISSEGINGALRSVSEVDPESDLGKEILAAYEDVRARREEWK